MTFHALSIKTRTSLIRPILAEIRTRKGGTSWEGTGHPALSCMWTFVVETNAPDHRIIRCIRVLMHKTAPQKSEWMQRYYFPKLEDLVLPVQPIRIKPKLDGLPLPQLQVRANLANSLPEASADDAEQHNGMKTNPLLAASRGELQMTILMVMKRNRNRLPRPILAHITTNSASTQMKMSGKSVCHYTA